jgi:hypothetical protein
MHDPPVDDGLGLDFDDGFRKDPDDADYVIWHGETAANFQTVHYLHGAMHLFDAGAYLEKYTWVKTGKPLVEQANEALTANLFPVFVAEGASDQKLTKIQHSAYLNHRYKSFCTEVGQHGARKALFIYGHSLAENDRHILDWIGSGRLAHVFISIFGDPDEPRNEAIRTAAEQIALLRPYEGTPLKIDYYDAESAQVWG